VRGEVKVELGLVIVGRGDKYRRNTLKISRIFQNLVKSSALDFIHQNYN
jgi:hypothetical protein